MHTDLKSFISPNSCMHGVWCEKGLGNLIVYRRMRVYRHVCKAQVRCSASGSDDVVAFGFAICDGVCPSASLFPFAKPSSLSGAERLDYVSFANARCNNLRSVVVANVSCRCVGRSGYAFGVTHRQRLAHTPRTTRLNHMDFMNR